MKQNTLIIVVVVVVAILGGASIFSYYYFYSGGDKDQEEKEEEIEEFIPPVAVIRTNATQAVVEENITFNSSGSSDVDGEIVSYEWDFDDGVRNQTNETEVIHKYLNSGYYNVTLRVTDDDSRYDTTSINITIIPKTSDVTGNEILLARDNPVIPANKTVFFEKQMFPANLTFNMSYVGASASTDLTANFTVGIYGPGNEELFYKKYIGTVGPMKNFETVFPPSSFSREGKYRMELVCIRGAIRLNYGLTISYE